MEARARAADKAWGRDAQGVSRDGEVLKTAAGVKEARTTLLEAHRLSKEMADGRVSERLWVERESRAGA